MPDLFILAVLSKPVTILGTQYMVTWDCLNNVANVLFKPPNEDEWQELDKTFVTELKAHEYLNNLATLQPPPPHDWRDICQNE